MEIRIANEKDMTSVFGLRLEVFVEEQNVPREIELDDEDSVACHFIADENGAAVGCARVIVNGNDAHLGRIAVKKTHRGQGIGAAICRYAIDYCRAQNCTRIWIHAQFHAAGFYEKLGFKPLGGIFMEAGIEHIEMEIIDIYARIFALADEKFRDFNAKLIPSVDKSRVIGVKTPELRSLAKELIKSGEADGFLRRLPHGYFEEDQLHAFILSEIRDIDTAIAEVERFLPYIDNWATCDQLIVKAFAKAPECLLKKLDEWLASGHTYTVRFAVGLLMRYFLDDRFEEKYLDRVAAIVSDEYYVNMMLAWYFATAAAKQYASVYPYFAEHRLPKWVHNKAIGKSCESFRVTDAHKSELRKLVRR